MQKISENVVAGLPAQLPIIALTASVMPEERQRCRDAGMDDFVSKPLSLDDLHRALARATTSVTSPL